MATRIDIPTWILDVHAAIHAYTVIHGHTMPTDPESLRMELELCLHPNLVANLFPGGLDKAARFLCQLIAFQKAGMSPEQMMMAWGVMSINTPSSGED